MRLDAALTRLFGFHAFRPGQREACEAALADRDVVLVMPTGSGKSLCYQLPALLREDLTVVVSPLVSLMRDQVDALEPRAPGLVAMVNAQQDPAANRDALARARSGALRVLYVAPERFSTPGFVERLAEASVGLFVVDEAHCVSQWGHDFRPDYFRLAGAARHLGARAVFASTATATLQVAADVVARLELHDPVRIATGFERPNLSYVVVPCASAADKRRRMVAALAEPDALPAIVYAGTRRSSEELAADLSAALDRPAVAYHAGLPRDERAAAQDAFMSGAAPVVVATNAFGMGVDKADVRTVCHAAVPGSVEAYYQEAGRAGRDGAPARCLLFAERRDKGLHVFFIQRAALADRLFERLTAALELRAAGGAYDVDAAELAAIADCEADGIRAGIGHLARAGVLEPSPAAPDRVAGRLLAPCDGAALARCRTSAAEAQRARWRQYRAVWAFVEQATCRREAILRHFGDRSPPAPRVPCCDVCDPALAPAGHAAREPAASALQSTDLEAAILEVVTAARPAVGRTRAVEILRGGRSRPIREHSYDGLPGYGVFSHLTPGEVMGSVDELLAAGALRSTGGRFPKLARA